MKNAIKRLLGIGQETNLANPWMTDQEFRKLLLSRDGSEFHGRTIPVGVDSNRNPITYGEPRPVLSVESPVGSKGSNITTSAAMTYTGSMVILDSFGDIAKKTAHHREVEFGHDVCILKPNGDLSINVLEILDPEHPEFVSHTQELAKHLLSLDGPMPDEPSSHFEKYTTLSLLTSLITAKLSRAHSENTKAPTLQEIYSLLSLSRVDLRSHLEELGVDVSHLDDRLFAGAVATLQTRLVWLESHAYASLLSGDTPSRLKPLDGKTTVYLEFDAGEIQRSPIVKVILFTLMTAQRRPSSSDTEVLYVLPDMQSLGHFDFLHIENVMTCVRWKIRLLGTVPSLSIFERKAGSPAAASWEANSGLMLFSDIHCTSDAEFVSRLLGLSEAQTINPTTREVTATSLHPVLSPYEVDIKTESKRLAVSHRRNFAMIDKLHS